MRWKKLVIALGLGIAAVFAVAYPRWKRLYQKPAFTTGNAVELYLDQDMNGEELAEWLRSEDIGIRNDEFRWAQQRFRWSNYTAGHYRFDEEVSYNKLFSTLSNGLQDPIRLTLLPGQSKDQIIESISSSFRFDSTALAQSLEDSSFLAKSQADTQDVLGRLYPATYQFYWTSSSKQVVERLLTTFEKKITPEMRSRLDEIDYSLQEILTLASIVEWEAKEDSEKSRISGLYWNRLRKGMKLQADPTVIYALGEHRRLTYKDYKIEHPYNTYLHACLPPGPVTNPSLSSIKAALFPEDNDYLYMVASPEGTHNFSTNYKEHQRKSAEWRRWIEKQYRIKRQRENKEN